MMGLQKEVSSKKKKIKAKIKEKYTRLRLKGNFRQLQSHEKYNKWR